MYNSSMKDLEKTVANNITELRKAQKWTQAELAEKLNYSDKSVSKWERGDSIPDLKVLSAMAELFGVTLDYFVKENAFAEREKYKVNKTDNTYRLITSLLGVMVVWLIATVVFVYREIAVPENPYPWMALVWAVPVSAIVMYRYSRKINADILSMIFSTAFLWTLITAAYLHCLVFGKVNLWMMFFIGAPMQAMAVLFLLAKRSK